MPGARHSTACQVYSPCLACDVCLRRSPGHLHAVCPKPGCARAALVAGSQLLGVNAAAAPCAGMPGDARPCTLCPSSRVQPLRLHGKSHLEVRQELSGHTTV